MAFKITDVCLQDDVAYIEVTVSDLELRWKELNGLSSGRKKNLDENYKLSQKFFKGAEDLMKMLDEAEQNLKNEEPIGVDPAHLRAQLKKHKVCRLQLLLFLLVQSSQSRIYAQKWHRFNNPMIIERFGTNYSFPRASYVLLAKSAKTLSILDLKKKKVAL